MKAPPTGALVALLLGVFVSQLPFALVQPLLPFLLDKSDADIGIHTGLLTATYAGAVALFAPAWGRLSDRTSRRPVILTGLIGLAAGLLALSFIGKLVGLYAGLALAGAFSAAVAPVTLAMLAERNDDDSRRARQFGWLYVAISAGLLAGPAIGGILGRMWVRGMPVGGSVFLFTALLAASAGLLLVRHVPSGDRSPVATSGTSPEANGAALPLLLASSAAAAWAIGAFEVGLTLRASKDLRLGPGEIGLMFVECMVVMVATQAVIFNRHRDPSYTRRIFAPSFLLLSGALLALAFASMPFELVLVTATMAIGLGALAPAIGYWISIVAPDLRGAGFGAQLSVASLGQALGAIGGAVLFSFPFRGAVFFVAASITLLAAMNCIRMNKMLSALIVQRTVRK